MSFADLRRSSGLTQAALAAASGINIRQIQKLEAGEILPQNITLSTAVRLASALGCRPEDLLPDAGKLRENSH